MKIGSLAVLILVLFPTLAAAGPGIAELALDRRAVADLIEAGLPLAQTLPVAGIGTVTLVAEGPRETLLDDGGVAAAFELRVPETGWAVTVDVRFVPRVEPRSGVVQLVPESIVPRLALPFDFDLSDWVTPIDLPRRLQWDLELDDGRTIGVTCFVQRVEIEQDRMRIELGLHTRIP